MPKPITGQYECLHRSGVGLDFFTSRINRLTLQSNGRFVLTVQDRSRIANAAQSLVSGQQVSTAAPETRREGNYTQQGNVISLRFDDGAQEQGQISWNGEGLQIGQDFFNKVSDSTLLPPTHRLKKDMDDIAKGIKIAGAIGDMAMKAAKTISETIQSTQEPGIGPAKTPPPPTQGATPPSPVQPTQQASHRPAAARPAQPVAPPTAPTSQNTAQPPGDVGALFCDNCGARLRPGKRFCNNCGAQLP